MLDMKWLRKDPKAVEAKLKTKDPSIDLSSIMELDEKMRDILVKVESLKAERNQLSKQIGEKKRLKEDTAELMQQVGGIGDTVTALDHELAGLEKELSFKVASLPNIPMDGSKVSPDPKDNVCIKSVGEKPTFSFRLKTMSSSTSSSICSTSSAARRFPGAAGLSIAAGARGSSGRF